VTLKNYKTGGQRHNDETDEQNNYRNMCKKRTGKVEELVRVCINSRPEWTLWVFGIAAENETANREDAGI